MKKEKQKKLSLCLIAVVIMAAVMLPFSALASENSGIDVTSSDYADGEGYTWDEATNTLTLTDVTLTGDGTGVGIILPHGKVTVVLVGNSTIQNFGQGVSQTNAGSSEGNSLLITGSGSLAITGCNYMSQGSFEDVTVDGAVLAGNNTNGLILNGNFVGKNGANIDLTVKNNDSNVWNTIYANGSIEIYDSTLKSNSGASGGIWAVGVKKDSALIKFVNSNITLSDSGWGAQSGSVQNPNGHVYIENSTITVNSAAGIGAVESAEVVGDVKFITESNRQILLAKNGDLTLALGEGADFQGYVNNGTDTLFATDYTLTEDFKVADGKTLTIPEGVTLTIAEGVTVTKGEGAKIINNGTIIIPCGAEGVIEVDTGDAPAVKHTFTNYVSNNDATCTEDGTETAVCDDCDVTDTRTDIGSALGHSYSEEWKSDENSHWHECTVCHDKANAASHTFKWVTDKEPTAEEKGSKHEECQVCGYKKAAVEIPASGSTTPEQPGTDKPEDPNTPQTGDSSSIVICAIAVSISAAAIAMLLLGQKRGRLN